MTLDSVQHPRCQRFLALAAALSTWLALSPAYATQEEDGAKAKTMFEQGRAAVKSGDLTRARELFLLSQGLVPKTATLFNLADCEERLGLLASAHHHFQEAVLLAPPGDERATTAKQRAQALEPRAPKLRVDFKQGTPSGARVLLENREIPSASLRSPQKMDPGAYVVTVTAPGRVDRTYVVQLRADETTALVVEPGAEKPVAARPKSSTAPQPDGGQTPLGSLQITGLALGGAGIVGVVVGAVTGGIALSRKDQLSTICPDPASCNKDGMSLANEGALLGTVSTVGFAAGGAALALGAGTFFFRRSATPSASILVGPERANLSLKWTF